MKKHITFLILLFGLISYSQDPIILYAYPPDRQKITEFEKRNDSLVISLENSGTNKVYIGDIAGVALGETSITAYRGDRGKTAYDHTSLSNNPHSVTKSQVGLGNVDNTSDANKPISTLTQTALNTKANINSPTLTGNVIVPTATISDAAVNLGQMMDSLATVGTGLIQEIASTKTLTKEDAWIVYRNRSITSEEFTYTIPNQANGGFTEDIGYTFYTKDNGKIFVKGETGSGVEPVEISGAGQYATITRFGSNNWDWSKGVLPWDGIVNIYNVANSASVINETNSTTGISPDTKFFDVASVDFSVTAPHDGLYCHVFTYPSGQTGQVKSFYTLDGLTIGSTYKVEIWAKRTNGGSNFSIDLLDSRGWDANDGTGSIGGAVTAWTRYELTGVATSTTAQIAVASASTSLEGYAIAIDGIIISEL